MRLLVAAFICSPLLAAVPAMAEDSFPYKAYAAAEDVYVRSGPGQNYYPTDKLKIGQEVAVYRHDPGGWCAIRPVDGSFTWVSSRYVKPTDDKLAVITEDNVQARVGSRFSDVRDVVQVRLHKGEVVELLDPPSHGSSPGESAWLRIAPPSGEFRWIASKYLDLEPPHDGVRKPHSAERGDRNTLGASGADADSRPSKSQPFAPEAYQAELERLEMELTAMVSEEPTAWSFDAVRDRANWLLDQAQTAVERGRARLLANKIARFEDIKQRYDSVQAMRKRTDRAERILAGLRSQDLGDRGAKRSDIDDRFDGVGQLTPVASPKLGAPRYALLDEAGDVRCYVTPAPGVNLQSYVGKQIGVNGTRGYMPEQHASHVMARHVTAIEGNILRQAAPGDGGVMHEQYMRLALEEAEQAMREDETPVGAVIVCDSRVIAKAHNQREQLHDPTAHAEMIAITQAAAALQSWRLEGCSLYVTLEPCPMCAGAILQARIPIVVFGAADPKAGAVRSLYRLLDDPRLNHRCNVTSGVLAEPCGQILSQFFQQQRRLGKK